MHTKNPRTTLAAFVAALLPLAAVAQTAPPPDQSASPTTVAAPAPSTASQEAVQLSPFEVTGEQTQGYSALNSNSITQFNQQLNKLPVSADIFDSQFMQDVGATSVEEMIQSYSAGAGINLSSPGGSAGNTQPNDRNGNTFVSLRGLEAPTMQLDGLMPLNTFFNSGATGTGYTSTFNIERADVVNGPQALLYGVGGAGGVINLVSKQAHFDQPSTLTDQYEIDNYGHKLDLFDFGVGADWFAVRVALTDQEQIGERRVNIGGPMDGQYAQIAIKLPHETVLRIEGTQTDYNRNISSTGVGFTALNSSNDARNGDSLRYLLATDQMQAAANGAPSGAGYIGGGTINWNNVDSYAGNLYNEETRDTYELASLNTKWTDWLSSQVSAGYRAETDDEVGSGNSFLAPNATTNIDPGQFAVDEGTLSGLYEPLREKVIRGSLAFTNDLFNGSAHSQTILGADYTRADGDVITYNYVLSDAEGHPILNGNPNTSNGYTFIGGIIFPAGTGPDLYPAPWGPGQKLIFDPWGTNAASQYYTRLIPNDTYTADVGPGNPLGLSGHGSGDHRIGKEINKGIYLANTTTWLNDKLTTLLGIRVEDLLEINQLETGFQTSGDLVPDNRVDQPNFGITSFNAGVNYELLPWLRPYAQVSDSDDPPAVLSADPAGNAPDIAHGIGEEVGVKIATPNGGISGSIAYFHAISYNEQYGFTSTLTNDINPAGLNGRYGAVSNFVNLNRETQGLQATLTANPMPNWRMRLSAAWVHATVQNGASYPQFYNDQFNENSAGDVTYSDGDIVYVNPTYNSKTLTVAPTTAGAIPLTVAMMNNSQSIYYADPAPVTAAISTGSAVGTVLRLGTEPGTGDGILTGKNGLPISDLQIAPLAASPPPGTILLANPGDMAVGYPQLVFNLTSLYTIASGPLAGFGFGGTIADYWKYADYYYYLTSVSAGPTAPREVFYLPELCTFNGILTYDRKFKRVEFLSQLNINNMFNHYHVIFTPNATANSTTVPGVTWDAQPREWTWSNTLKF